MRLTLAVTVLASLILAAPAAADPTVDRLRGETHRAMIGTDADCNQMAWAYHLKLRAAGVESRIVVARASLLNLYDSHAFVEVRADGRWVVSDPTFDGEWRRDGRTLSARDLQRALKTGAWRAVRWTGPQEGVRGYYTDPRLLFRHLTYRTQNADDGWFVSRGSVSLPALYYARAARPAGATAGIVVSDAPGTVNGYELARLGGRWVSPIHLIPAGFRPAAGATLLWVPRYR